MEIQKVKLQMVKESSITYNVDKIKSPEDVVKLINEYEQYNLDITEKIIIIGLNNKNQVNIYTEVVSGNVGYANFKVYDLFKSLLLSNSNKFIMVHNHPSGDITPSKEDLEITEHVLKVSKLMSLDFLDHIIIGDGYTSIMSILKGDN